MKDPRFYLIHILDSIERIQEYSAAGRQAYDSSSMMQDAIVRNFEIVGEASRRIPQDVRDQTPHIRWNAVIGFRNILIHQYDRVDHDEVWRIINHDLQPLKEQLEELLDQFGGRRPLEE